MQEMQESERIVALHRDVRAQFCQPKDGFRFWRYLKALDRYEGDSSVLALEAKVMLLLQRRKRAFEVRKCMARLFELRSACQQMEAFQAFDAFLKSHVPPEALASHGNQLFADQSDDSIWSYLRPLIQKLRPLAGEVFLNSGALLGVVREGKLLDHDDDVDLGVILRADSFETAAQRWQELRLTLFQQGLARVEEQNDGRMRAIILASPEGFTIDLFPAWIEDGKVFVFPHTHGELDASDVLPLQTCAVSDLPIPAKPEKMLAVNYGADWREPNPYFVFPWREANHRFAPFLQLVGDGVFKRVLTYGTFDLFHVGHQRLFKRLSRLADEVIVGCSTCEFNAIKGKRAVLPYAQRAEMLEACKYVTKVIPENGWGQKRADIVKYSADLFVMGDDWLGEFDDLSDLCQVLYLPRTADISTTKLKFEISSLAAE